MKLAMCSLVPSHRGKTEWRRAFVLGVKRGCREHLSAPSDSVHIYRAPLHRYCPVRRLKSTAMILSSGVHNQGLCSSCDNVYLPCKTLVISWEIQVRQQEMIILTSRSILRRLCLWTLWQGKKVADRQTDRQSSRGGVRLFCCLSFNSPRCSQHNIWQHAKGGTSWMEGDYILHYWPSRCWTQRAPS